MFVIPAIDIKDGKCVRLFQGDFNQVTSYGDDPVKIAQAFVGNKAQMLNVIDLDGAKSGAPVNKQLILEIVKAVTIPVQVGGGIRTYEDARDYLDGGVRRVILSTAAIEDPALIKRLIDDFGTDSLIIAAAHLGATRLLDNVAVGPATRQDTTPYEPHPHGGAASVKEE